MTIEELEKRKRLAEESINVAGMLVKIRNPRLTLEQAKVEAMRAEPELYKNYQAASAALARRIRN